MLLYEVADDRDLPGAACGEDAGLSWRMRARHRLREPERPVDRASDADIVALLRACRSARDRLVVPDVHLLADSRGLGCEIAGAHVHLAGVAGACC
jgi:integrase/recombinase XerD